MKELCTLQHNENVLYPVDKIEVGIGAIFAFPLLLIALYIVIEIVGYVANHATTYMQTKGLTAYIEKSIEDVSIVDVYSNS